MTTIFNVYNKTQYERMKLRFYSNVTYSDITKYLFLVPKTNFGMNFYFRLLLLLFFLFVFCTAFYLRCIIIIIYTTS